MPSLEVGRVVSLWRYPVKSMASEALSRVQVSWHGFEGDRRWAFIRPGIERSGFPWLTIREKADLWRYQPRFVAPDQPKTSETRVTTPSGADFDVADGALAAELGRDIRVIKQDIGIYDTFPLSVLSVQAVEALRGMSEVPMAPNRFRPNLLIDAPGLGAFPEDGWVGSVLRIGDFAMRVDKRDQRCVMTNIDPQTLESDPRVLKTLAKERESCLGVYGTTVARGTCATGDPVFLEQT